MKKLPHLVAALALSSLGILSAQTAPDTESHGHRRGGHRGPGGHPIIRALDADKDGEISAAEIANAPAALKTLDLDGDGAISAAELHARRSGSAPTPPAGAPARHGDGNRPVDPVMLALDADKDGALSATEIANAAASLKALDANSDGKLTPDELRPLPPAKN